MPSESVLDLYKTKFTDTLEEIAQQSDSRLVDLCVFKSGIPENYAYERVGTVEPRKLEGRIQPVIFDSINHDRRWLEKEFYVLNLPVDEKDLENMVTDPRSAYARAINYAFNRQKDRIIVAAAIATVKTGKTIGASTLTAAADGVLTVTATGGIDYTDLVAINRNFTDNEVGISGSNKSLTRKVFVITGEEEAALLQQAQLTSGDYDRRYQLERGELQYALGIELVKFGGTVANPVLPVTVPGGGGNRTCIVLAQDAILLGVGHDFNLKIQERMDLENVWQIKGDMSAGAVRLEGNRVQIVTTSDA